MISVEKLLMTFSSIHLIINELVMKLFILGEKMSDTLGSLIDKLYTVDMKLWYSQELVYEIRRMTYEEFKEKYFENEEGFRKFYEALNKATELNYQRNQLIDEIDEKVIEIVESGDREKFIQRKHKTY